MFYATGFKYSERAQAEDRIHRIGQTRPCTYIDIAVDCGIDRRIIAAVRSKGATLAAFRAELDACRRKGMKGKLRALIASI